MGFFVVRGRGILRGQTSLFIRLPVFPWASTYISELFPTALHIGRRERPLIRGYQDAYKVCIRYNGCIHLNLGYYPLQEKEAFLLPYIHRLCLRSGAPPCPFGGAHHDSGAQRWPLQLHPLQSTPIACWVSTGGVSTCFDMVGMSLEELWKLWWVILWAAVLSLQGHSRKPERAAR